MAAVPDAAAVYLLKQLKSFQSIRPASSHSVRLPHLLSGLQN